jgi:hypothetical protein
VKGRLANIYSLVAEATRAGAMPSVIAFFRGRPGKRPLAPLPAHDPRHVLRTAPGSGLRATHSGNHLL